MADYTKLNANVAELSAKIDAYIAKPVPTPVDDQAAVDAIADQVAAITAKIPA